MVAICNKYCYVLLINLYYIPDPLFLLHAILETALTHLRNKQVYRSTKILNKEVYPSTKIPVDVTCFSLSSI